MSNQIKLIKQISKDLNKDWREELLDYNFPATFTNIYSLDTSIENKNRIICFIYYSYSPDSLWLDLNKDREENKTRIFTNLGADINSTFIQEVLNNSNEIVGTAIFDFLEDLKTWKWRAIFELNDYASRMFKFATQETEEEKSYQKMNKEGEVTTITKELDIDVISKVNKEKGILLDQAIAKKSKADELLEQIRKEFVTTDNATQQDFSFAFTSTATKRGVVSWRQFIKERNEKKTKAQLH